MTEHASPELAIRMVGIKKSFDGVTVLKGVDFEVARGEIHALAGGNGAGKSTLMKILQGVYTKDAGQIEINGRDVELTSIHAAKAAGIGMVFQEFSLVPSLTVAQNIYLAAEPMSRGLIDDREAVRRSRQVFEEMGVEVDPRARVSELSTAYWQLTEIAKALAQDAQVLIMDEPTASLARHETEALFELIDRLKARGIAIVYISHRMDEVYRIADRITILRDGNRLLTEQLADITPAQIVEGIVGKEMGAEMAYRERSDEAFGDVLLEARNLTAPTSGERRLLHVARRRDPRPGRADGQRPDGAGPGAVRHRRPPIGRDHPPWSAGQPELTAAGHCLRSRPDPGGPPRPGAGAGPLGAGEPAATAAQEGAERNSAEQGQEPIAVRRPDQAVHGQGRPPQPGGPAALGWQSAEGGAGQVAGHRPGRVDLGRTDRRRRHRHQERDSRDDPRTGHAGKGVIVISSEYPELLAVSDRIIILRDGSVAAELPRKDIADEEALQLAVQGVPT